jgi:glutathione S-transferase
MAGLELIQFHYSHFNEKVRWALDWKRVPHRRTTLLPGPHGITVKRLTGQTETPVVRFSDSVVHGSADIIAALEERYPDPPLYPDDPDQRRRALEIQARFDSEVGPAIRRALFAVLLDFPGYLGGAFSEGRNPMTRSLYKATIPFVRPMMRRSMGIDREGVEKGLAATSEALDFVARESSHTGQLTGDRFSVADLAAAALLAPAVQPPSSPMHLPEPRPEPLERWVERWASHPGTAWVLRQYREHRRPSAEV